MYVNANGAALLDSGATTNTIATGSANTVRVGTAKNDLMNSSTGDTMRGGLGDDTYYLWNASSSVGEQSGEGVDTAVVKYWGAATLAANVENLILASGGATSGTGNALANVITAGTVGATLNGAGGDDVLVGGTGADLFRVQAGNGSDAIVNFETGKDSIQLQNYGFTSFAQVMTAATQIGGTTSIALGNGETLQLQGIAKNALVAADFGFQAATVSTAAGTAQMTAAGKANTFNGWTVFNNVWGQGSLKEGTDFTIASSYNRADMTAGTSFTWTFPYSTNSASTILAYPEVAFGVPPKSIYYAGNPSDKANTFPIALDKLHGLSATYDVSIGGTTSGFNVSYDVWLTSKPNGDKSTITNEIMIWVHKGEVQPFGSLVGTYTQGDFTAKIYHTGTYTAVIADSDKLAGTIDIAAVIHKLQDIGIVTGQQYVAGVELGAEVVSGVGSMTINNLDLTVESVADNGNIVVKQVTGASTTVSEMPAFALDYTAGTVKEYDHDGVQIGTTLTTVDTSGVTIKHLDLQSRIVSTDLMTAGTDGSVTTKHYDAGQSLTGYDVQVKNSDGSEVVRHFTAGDVLAGFDKLLTDAQGRDWAYHYDANAKLTGADKTIYESATTTTVQHVDTTGKVVSADKTIQQGNVTTTQHFEGGVKLTGADVVTINADGSVRTQHYDGAWGLTGVDVASTNATGVTTETQYNAKFQVVNTLYTGSVGADAITGTANTNSFHGGFGSDTLKLGAGVDNVYFDTAIGTNVDRVLGFSAAKDTLYLNHDVFAGLKAGVLDAGSFVQGTAAKDANDHIVYDEASGSLWYDADGSGTQKAILFAQLDPNTVITNADFVIF